MTLAKKLESLFTAGYYVGPRWSHRNEAHKGAYMVAANGSYSKVTRDAGDGGGFCIVGDNVEELVNEAFEQLDT